jgi:putative membrane protein insertion efficiency factor
MKSNSAQKILVWVLKKYQKILSPDTGVLKKIGIIGNVCVFYPTCSEYTIQAVEKYGVSQGLWKGFRRILRCHPWQKIHIDELK